MVSIREELIPRGRGNRPGLPMVPLGVTVHNAGNPNAGPTLVSKYVRGLDASRRPASWHYTVGRDTPASPVIIIRQLPEDEVAWHAGDGGSGPGNRTTIAIEICDNVMVAGEIDPEVRRVAALLVADICRRHEWEAEVAA